MLFKWICHLLSDVFTSLYRRITKRKCYICKFPFQHLSYAPKGYTCCSNTPVKGKYTEYSSPIDFYNSPQNVELRNKILKGDYSGCPEWCHILVTGEREAKKSWGRLVVGYGRVFGEFRKLRKDMLSEGKFDTIHMVAEDSCNLRCLMCRDKPRGNTISDEMADRVWKELIDDLPHMKTVHLGGSGEPLLQKRSLDFLNTLKAEDAPNLECVYLITNGNLLTPEMWNNFSPFVKEKLELQVSVDAATKETYERVRRGGDFDKLVSNLTFLRDVPLRSFALSMCVQEQNFRDMRAFIDFARSFNATITFGQIFCFPDSACDLPEHKDHNELLEILADDAFMADDIAGYFIYELRDKYLSQTSKR